MKDRDYEDLRGWEFGRASRIAVDSVDQRVILTREYTSRVKRATHFGPGDSRFVVDSYIARGALLAEGKTIQKVATRENYAAILGSFTCFALIGALPSSGGGSGSGSSTINVSGVHGSCEGRSHADTLLG